VFAGVGERTREGNDLYNEMSAAGVIKQDNLGASKSPGIRPDERAPGRAPASRAVRLAMTEYFRDEKNQDVLLFIDNIFRFSQAGLRCRLCLAAPPGPSVTSRLSIRNGGASGSITSTRRARYLVQAVYVPADDLSDPARPPRSRTLTRPSFCHGRLPNWESTRGRSTRLDFAGASAEVVARNTTMSQ